MATRPKVRFEIFEGTITEEVKVPGTFVRPTRQLKRYYWRATARNRKIIAVGGEPFVSKSNAKRAVKTLTDGLSSGSFDVREV